MVPIPLDEVDEIALTLVKEYGLDYNYIMDEMYYSDMTVYYAKIVNDKAFTSYSEYIHMDEQQKGSYVTEYGTPEPYVFRVLTPKTQKENIKKSNNSLREMYRNGGKLDD